MSNVWSYMAFVPVQTSLSVEKLSQLVSCCAFSERNPETGKVHVNRVDKETLEFEDLRFDKLEEVANRLVMDGALLSIWQESIDIALGFDITGQGEKWRIKTHQISDTPMYGKVSILANDSIFKSSLVNGRDFADEIEKLFMKICLEFDAFYGLAADESFLEYYWKQLEFHDDIRLKRKPSVLSWFNYFQHDYAQRIPINILEEWGATILDASSGTLVRFFDSPIDVNNKVLQKTNEMWHVAKLPG